jgi:tetratricopeptide (TPR) repeat protein
MATFSRYTAFMVQRRYRDILTMLDESRSEVSRDGLVYHPTSLMRAEAYRGLGDSVLARRNFEIARSLLADSIAVNPGNSSMRSALALAYAGLGRKEAAVREAEKAMDLSGFATNTMNATAFMGLAVETYARIGEIDRAFQMIELMLTMPSGREITVPYLQVWPGFDPLRGDPRFDELVKRFPLRFDG